MAGRPARNPRTYAILDAMDGVSLVTVIGLVVALAAALLVIRRRTSERDALAGDLIASRPASPPAPAPPASAQDSIEDLLPVGILRIAGGRVTTANARAHVLLGITPGRLVGRTVMETFVDTRIEALLDGLAPDGTATAELRSPEADDRTVLLRASRPGDASLIVVLEDVSELRRLRQIRSAFIDNLSHELRTPLSTVSLLAETLAREAELADVPIRMRDRIAKIEIETGHIVQMVSEMMDLARIEGGSPLVLDDDVDLGRLAEASAERLRLFAERQGVTLVVDAAPGTPTIRGDEARLGQVFVNLVHNAVKFSPDGGVVRVTVRPEGDEVVAAVEDHGIGIAKADRARVFERFYKVDRARVRGGTGLGLAIARHVIAAHGGRIGVESEEGRGSTFWFAVPRRPPAGAANSTQPEQLALSSAGDPGA